MSSIDDILQRIERALCAARDLAHRYTPGATEYSFKSGDDPVTAADRELNSLLHTLLPEPGEGWLSEESADDLVRLEHTRVWVVDPLDGTREFVAGIPEWCISIGLVEDGQPVAGGICNPATGEIIVGGQGCGVTYNGVAAQASTRPELAGALVLASRSEVKRGEWRRFENSSFQVRPMGSVAYKLGLVAAGKADATWTLTPKHEWDVAAGVALVRAAGGFVDCLDLSFSYNSRSALLPGLLAGGPQLRTEIGAAVTNVAVAANIGAGK